MGSGTSKRIVFLATNDAVICYKDRDHCTSSGRVLPVNTNYFSNVFVQSTDAAFDDVVEGRKEMICAKLKYRKMDVQTVKDRYPNWTEDMILDLKGQFQTFDLNLDGVIEFEELCAVLDQLGDASYEPARRLYFEQLDVDGSGAIDFEEYLMLIDTVLCGKSTMPKIGQLCKAQFENAQKLRQLSIVQQINLGLF